MEYLEAPSRSCSIRWDCSSVFNRRGRLQQMITFAELMEKRIWKPIPNCPGRYTLLGSAGLSPDQLVGVEHEVDRFQVAAARDTVLVVPLDKGGLISYERADGSFVHTLNTAEGFERKLLDLGIKVSQEEPGSIS